MAQRFDELFTEEDTEEEKARVFEGCHSAVLLFLDTPAAIILLHPVKVVPKVWYLVGIDLIEAPTTSQNGNRFLLSRRCKRPLYKLCDSHSAVLLFLDTPAAIILLHPVKVVPKVWYLVGIDLIEAPTTSQNGNRFLLSRRCKRPLYKLCDTFCVSSSAAGSSCTGLKCHAY